MYSFSFFSAGFVPYIIRKRLEIEDRQDYFFIKEESFQAKQKKLPKFLK